MITKRLPSAIISLLLAAGVFFFAQHGLWPLAILLVLVVEAGTGLRVPMILAGMSAAIIIAVEPREITQAVVAALYAVWRWWSGTGGSERYKSLPNLLVVQLAIFEALFLMAAVWQTNEWLVLLLVWVGAYLSVYSVLALRGERAAAVMAATWALVATEIAWVLLRWLFVYTVTGGYLLVPQPALILAGLGYCFGSIYVSQREGKLSRARLTEYLLIGLILIAVVITGTPWRGTL